MVKKLVIAGSRDLHISAPFFHHIFSFFNLDAPIILTGGATGIDTTAINFAAITNREIKVLHAEWEKYGKSAGPIRNTKLSEEGDALLLIWDGKSRGSADMKRKMESKGKPIYEFIIKGEKK